MSQKILLLGGSAQQVIAIETARRMGYYTVLCDYLPDNPGQYSADKYYNASTTDIDAVYEIAKREGVSGILAYASDPAALPAAIVAERLGLPTNPSKSVEILGVKHTWRKFLKDNGFACPGNLTFSSDTPLEEITAKTKNLQFPIVIKPTDSSGSKGVTMLRNFVGIKEAVQWAKQYSRNNILIAEEFIDNAFHSVVGGDIFVWNGKIILYGEMSCIRDNAGSGLIPIGERKPSGLNERQTEDLHRELQRLITMLKIKFGELNIEVLFDRDDKAHFLEVGPRAGGNMIPIQLSDAFGVDLVEANIAAAMGCDPELRIHEKPGCFFTYVLHSHVDGILEGVDFSEEIAGKVYRKALYKKPGDKVEAFDGAGKAIGIVFMHADTEREMNDICSGLDELIRVRVNEIR